MKMKKQLKIDTTMDQFPTSYTGENVENKELLTYKVTLNSQEKNQEKELASLLEVGPTSIPDEVPKKKRSRTPKKTVLGQSTVKKVKVHKEQEQTSPQLCPVCGKAYHSLSWPYSTQQPTADFETALTTLLNGYTRIRNKNHQCVVGSGELRAPERRGGYMDWKERYGLTQDEAGLMDMLTNLSHYSMIFTTILTKYRAFLTTCFLRLQTDTPLECLQRVDSLTGHLDTLCSLLTETSGPCGQIQTCLLTKKQSSGALNISDLLRAGRILKDF